MICACLLGLPAIMLVLMSMYCIRLPNDTSAVKMKRARVGGVLFILMCKQKNTQRQSLKDRCTEQMFLDGSSHCQSPDLQHSSSSVFCSRVWHHRHRVVSHRLLPEWGSDVIWVFALRRLDWFRPLPRRWDHDLVLLQPWLLDAEPWEQFLLLQKSRNSYTTGPARQPPQECQGVRCGLLTMALKFTRRGRLLSL